MPLKQLIGIMSIVEELKSYFNNCLEYEDYGYTGDNTLIAGIKDWLEKKEYENEYKKYYVYLAWFSVRELLLKKFDDVPTIDDVIVTMMEYPVELVKYICYNSTNDESSFEINVDGPIIKWTIDEYRNYEIDTSDRMWLYDFMDDCWNRQSIYKILTVARYFKKTCMVKRHDEPMFDFPESIEGSLSNTDVVNVSIKPADEVITDIIKFLQQSYKNKEWCFIEQHSCCYNMLDWVQQRCKGEKYHDYEVQYIYACVLYVLKYGYDYYNVLRNQNNVDEFWSTREMLQRKCVIREKNKTVRDYYDYIDSFAETIAMRCKEYGGMIHDDIHIKLPEYIDNDIDIDINNSVDSDNKETENCVNACLEAINDLMSMLNINMRIDSCPSNIEFDKSKVDKAMQSIDKVKKLYE